MKNRKWIVLIVEILVIWLFLTHVGISYVSGDSMLPTLASGDVLIHTRWGSVEKGDIIVFKVEKLNRLLVKRIHKIENGRYYVIGDNLSNSEDSRNPLIGWVSEDNIKGKAVFRILPLNRWGELGGQ